MKIQINPLNAKLNPIYHLLALLGAHHILHVSRIRVKTQYIKMTSLYTTEPWLIAIFTALEYTAISWISRTLCSRFTPRGCRVSIPHSPATALVSRQALCFSKVECFHAIRNVTLLQPFNTFYAARKCLYFVTKRLS